ncbi:MAG TPA: hypothetical protein VKY45_04835 [Marinilabiliaceae bacterium]|nr:hypothetical protein [Marinilabiliaceae bacterium]
MWRDKESKIQEQVKKLHEAVNTLKESFPSKNDGFTLDGRLVGDIGEVVAEHLFQIKLHEGVTKYYDAVALYDENIRIQIKATFKNSLTYNHNPDYYIGIKLYEDGGFKVVYNGPGRYIKPHYGHRKGFGEKLLSFPISKLAKISRDISPNERIQSNADLPIRNIYYEE